MRVTISRFNPECDTEPHTQDFDVPDTGRTTVLQALMHIRERIDSTLVFNFDCRYKNCGLCAMMINGRPQLACLAILRDDTVVEPLRHLPVLRDLAIDRRRLFQDLGLQAAYLAEPPLPLRDQVVLEPPERRALMACNECLACVAGCPSYRYDDRGFAGPMVFVKLTQLLLDPRDKTDRRTQARDLGVETCRPCPGCPCPSGIPIRKGAIAALLGED